MRKFIGYYRVSTRAQGISGLGLEAQRKTVAEYVAGVNGTLLEEYEEIESGSYSERPRLKEAVSRCKKLRAVLVIAKLDRLARNVRFISQLIESRIEFVAADMPTASKLTIHIFAAMAEYERDAISQRTKDSLRAAKERGIKLGNPNARLVSGLGVQANIAAADAFAKRIYPTIEALRASGCKTYASVARALDASGVRTQRGKTWTAAGVRNILTRSFEKPRR